jgi:hypothetical protein
VALEFEFGDEYRRFANERDQLPEDHGIDLSA